MLTTSKPTLTTPAPTFRQALLFWLKLGLISFGGPAGQVAIMHEFLVTKNRWLSEERFLHALNYCMVLPGPEAQQLATYTGWLLHGTRGGLVAGILFVLPSVFILLAMSIVYVVFGQAPWIYALFNGLKPAVIAIVIQALIKIGKKSLLTPFHYVVALAAFTGLFFFNLPFPLIILAALITAVLLRKFAPGFYGTTSQKTSPPEAEPELRSVAGVSLRWLFGQLAIFALLWLLPFILLALFAPGFAFWKTLSLFFTQAAFITFGGAYAVLPYVAQFTVEELHWLTQAQVMDGLAMGETTPGPLIMVLAFVGFMGGYNHFGQNLWLGSLALLLTVFIPSCRVSCLSLSVLLSSSVHDRTSASGRCWLWSLPQWSA